MPFQIALSGLNAASTSLSTTANNIANVNTTGFKGSRANFVELFATGLQNVSENATGLGARPSSIQQLFSQGSLEFTDNNLDLSLVGGGFFTLQDAQGAISYTRAGNFSVNREGFVVNDQGLRLQAFPTLGDTEGFNTGRVDDLRLETTDFPPNPTSTAELGLNLPSDAEPPPAFDNTAPNNGFDPSVPDSYNQTTSITVFDSLGRSRTASYFFVKNDDPSERQWDVYLTVEGVVDANDDLEVFGPATLEFDEGGSLDPALSDELFSFGPIDVDPAADLDLESDFTSVTQFGSTFNVNNLQQNGFASGRLASIDITSEGIVFARFTNGQSDPLGQLAITNFTNPEGLENVSDTRWAETFESGEPLRGAAGTGNLGTVQSGALEAANVDLAKELVDMITAQRTFQANAQMISTADQVTQTIINIR